MMECFVLYRGRCREGTLVSAFASIMAEGLNALTRTNNPRTTMTTHISLQNMSMFPYRKIAKKIAPCNAPPKYTMNVYGDHYVCI